MSVAVKRKPVAAHNSHFKINNKKKPNNSHSKKRRRITSDSVLLEKDKSYVPGGDETDPLNLKNPDLTLSYTPSPDYKKDLPNPVVFVDQSDPLCLKRSPKRKRERKYSRHKSSTSDDKPPDIKFNEKAKKFSYGNYSKYYGYRNPAHEADPRLQFLDSSLFAGKDVLDLGCNIGHITLTIAKDYEPKKILGVDIDGNLINIARKNIRRYLSKEKSSEFPVSMQVCYGPLFGQGSDNTTFPNNVAFRQENWVPSTGATEPTEMFDVILCLSVTKWVHLNWGDCGIKDLFNKMYQSIRPGGKLILECQHWKGYGRRKKLTATIYKNYQEIRILPHEFPQYLQMIGFTQWRTLGVPSHNQKGFRRPIWMFTKPETIVSPSQDFAGSSQDTGCSQESASCSTQDSTASKDSTSTASNASKGSTSTGSNSSKECASTSSSLCKDSAITGSSSSKECTASESSKECVSSEP